MSAGPVHGDGLSIVPSVHALERPSPFCFQARRRPHPGGGRLGDSGRQPRCDDVAEKMIGTTRSRVNFFMNTFRKLGVIEYNRGSKINPSLFGVVLHD